MIEMRAPGVYPDRAHKDTAVEPSATPPTDASRLTLPLAWVVGIVITVGGFGVTQALNMAAMRSDVRDILTKMQYEAQMNAKDEQLFDARFKALEAKIDAAGLRNFNMMQAQELAKGR